MTHCNNIKISSLKNSANIFWFLLAVILLCTCALSSLLLLNSDAQPAYADTKTVQATGYFHQKLISSYDEPMEQTYNYEFYPLDAANPMPEGSTGGKFTFSMTGNTDFVTSITYTEPGTYLYKCNLITPEPELENYVYDKRIIDVKVVIVLKPTGELSQTSYFANEEGEKTFDPEWIHTFNGKSDDETQEDLLYKLLKTSDATLPVAIFGIGLLLVAAVLYLVYNGKTAKRKNTTD